MYDKVAYSKAMTEVLYVLERTDESIVSKIPKELIEKIKKLADKEYKYDPEESNENIEDLDLSEEAKAFIAVIYRDYICDENERNNFNKKLNEKLEKIEEEKKQNYPVENLFNNENRNNNSVMNELVQIKEQNFIIRIINKIKSIFNVKR